MGIFIKILWFEKENIYIYIFLNILHFQKEKLKISHFRVSIFFFRKFDWLRLGSKTDYGLGLDEGRTPPPPRAFFSNIFIFHIIIFTSVIYYVYQVNC